MELREGWRDAVTFGEKASPSSRGRFRPVGDDRPETALVEERAMMTKIGVVLTLFSTAVYVGFI